MRTAMTARTDRKEGDVEGTKWGSVEPSGQI